ncbi:type IV pilus twitching motility protein PilT [Desulfosporosinus sp. BICA1-9]|uniref:type IV pilus twitching motility protein PilT n=1 Tax=Desulfosporosinus sp. BICA1-9 TaxID=1531958 RepID=UPI00054B069B|nr:type IV pilus twitching motility protein PilT [Desulfosporosinus sp. BICA1-9]KJS49797.1 MAG: twitching motility protein PilT [Peptococcaceae bacterium BRH_c23]KJS78813.1 MAG: twitching motility protein PilT [Desulfosporosinus sp. BICA1-9]HBW36196.1 type IV pilus twitching motility protein PilT [Desulfosporosinus sp.]
MLTLKELLIIAGERKSSDIHLTVESPPVLRIDGSMVQLQADKLSQSDLETFALSLMNETQAKRFAESGELDLSYSLPGIGRYRVNVFRQRGSIGVVIRLIPFVIPSPESLGLPAVSIELARLHKGLVLVTGPTGSGKSTTLASLVDYINRTRSCHIVTIEDPIEYLHRHNLSLVNQREVGNDTMSFTNALRAVLRQDPDVILVGEMRDLETIATAVTAAETGHLVFSTLHTNDATQSVDRMIDVFPPHQQQQIRVQLAAVLQGIMSQQLFPRADKKGRVAAIEVMLATPAVRSLIREGKTHQLPTVIQTNVKLGMQTMDKAILDLVQKGLISAEVAQGKLQSPDSLRR